MKLIYFCRVTKNTKNDKVYEKNSIVFICCIFIPVILYIKNDKEYSLAEEHIKICLRLLRVING